MRRLATPAALAAATLATVTLATGLLGCGPRPFAKALRQDATAAYGLRGVAEVPLYDSLPDPAAVFAECRTLPLAVNLHFFTTDDCARDGIAFAPDVLAGMGVERFTIEQATSASERLIANANTYFREISDNPPINNVAHGARDHAPQCVPVRLVLAGVYVHCDSETAARKLTASRIRPFLVNPDTELNYFIGRGRGTDGFANRLGGTMGAMGGFAPNTFVHEVMHLLSLNHVFGDDGCDDTWGNINWTWDADGDGTVDARGARCWSWLPTPVDPATGEMTEPDYCAEGNYATVHPCCLDVNQNNNLMTYSNYASDWHKATLSPCQVERAVTHAITEKADYLYGVRGRRPPETYPVEVIPSPAARAAAER